MSASEWQLKKTGLTVTGIRVLYLLARGGHVAVRRH